MAWRRNVVGLAAEVQGALGRGGATNGGRMLKGMRQRHPLCVRFGEIPEGGRSFDAVSGRHLGGVSAYPGRMSGPDLFVVGTRCLRGQLACGALLFFAAQERPAFFVRGPQVGRGRDGEPLLEIEYSRPVPASTRLAASEAWAQRALDAWSSGPRDRSAFFRAHSVLSSPAGRAAYLPDGVAWDDLYEEVVETRREAERGRSAC